MSEPFTPGPWELGEAVKDKWTGTTNMRRIRSAAPGAGTEHGAVCEVYGIRDGTIAAANARLIAAAPDLLSAAQQVIESMGPSDIPPSLSSIEVLRAAIAKATDQPSI